MGNTQQDSEAALAAKAAAESNRSVEGLARRLL